MTYNIKYYDKTQYNVIYNTPISDKYLDLYIDLLISPFPFS